MSYQTEELIKEKKIDFKPREVVIGYVFFLK